MALTVLFADPDPRLPDALGEVLDEVLDEVDVSVVTTAAEARAAWAARPADVLVSDLALPDGDGLGLLREARTELPEAVRVVLSADISPSIAAEASRVSHQWITKPTVTSNLPDVIRRITAVHGRISSHTARQIASDVESLPSVPDVVFRVLAMLDAGDDLVDIGSEIEGDPALSARVLQAVNSSYFGLNRTVSAPRDAASLLGTAALTSLVLAAGLDLSFSGVAPEALETIQERGKRAAAMVRHLAKEHRIPIKVAGPAFTAALLRDVGVLALIGREQGSRWWGSVLNSRLPEGLDCTVAEISAYLLTLWNIPEEVVAAVEAHERAGEVAGEPTVAALVHAAVVISDGRPDLLDEAWLSGAGLSGAGRALETIG